METIDTLALLSEALQQAIKDEMELRGIQPEHYSSIETQVHNALNNAKAKDEFLKLLGIFETPGYADTRNFMDRKKEIKSFFSENYVTWKLARPQQVVIPGKLDIREMQPGKDGTYRDAYDSFGRPRKDMAVSENFILMLMFAKEEDFEEKEDWEKVERIRQVLDMRNRWIHFLIAVDVDGEQETQFFVVDVDLDGGGWRFGLGRLGNADVYDGDRLNRFVAAV